MEEEALSSSHHSNHDNNNNHDSKPQKQPQDDNNDDSSSNNNNNNNETTTTTTTTTTLPKKKIPLVVAVTTTYPWTIYLTGLFLSLLLTYFSLGFFNMDDPLAGLRIRNHVSAERSDAHFQMLREQQQQRTAIDDQQQYRNSQSVYELEILYFASQRKERTNNNNVFTVENIARIQALEDALWNNTGYQEDYCLRDLDRGNNNNDECAIILSPVRYLQNATTQDEIDQGVWRMWKDRHLKKDGTLLHFCKEFASDANNNNNNNNNTTHNHPPKIEQSSCHVTKTKVRFGLPLRGYTNANDRRD